VSEFYNQEGKEYVNKTTGRPFYSGLTNRNGEKAGEYIIEGKTQSGEATKIRLSNWELVYKTIALVKYCKEKGLKFAGQTISFKRVSAGAENAGQNWEVLCSSLKVIVSGKDNTIKEF
jgi:hypothetical protein